MKTHYFQRYHTRENVETANAMLLLSRLYSFSSKRFFQFLERILPNNANIELEIGLQVKNKNSVPDAVIYQKSFKIVVETKLNGAFSLTQLESHLSSFANEDYKVLLTLDPTELPISTTNSIETLLSDYNSKKQQNNDIIHRHLTFEKLVDYIIDVVDPREYELLEITEEYREYCYESNLIINDWKMLRVRTAGDTLEINKKLRIYYDGVKGYSGHQYLGLYNNKSVKAIGKIVSVVTAVFDDDKLLVIHEKGLAPNNDMKNRIKEAIIDSKKYGYNLVTNEHRYFFVDEFVETDFKKTSSGSLRATKFFNLCDLLDVAELPNTYEIARRLCSRTWE
jgi:hypothetical protein